MSNINFHNSPFGESTQVKLLLFEDYIIEWLPVFLSAKVKYYKTINVFDFFCGPGKDSNGIHGSPAIILKSLRRYYRYLNNPEITINVFLNDENSDKVKALKQMINKEQLDNGLGINIYYSSLDFKDAFDKYYQLMNQRSSANLILLDQCGVSLVDFERLSLIMNLKTTDFIMFIASSSIRRFAQTEEIKKYFDTSKFEFTSNNYYETHRMVTEYLRIELCNNPKMNLIPFSLKKNSNIYGLIFGSAHIKGAFKFLKNCWKIDPDRGDANFDIDNDNLNPNVPSLFRELNTPKKLLSFEKELINLILSSRLKTNIEIIKFSISHGFLPTHAKQVVQIMINEKLIPKQKIRISENAFSKQAVDFLSLKDDSI